MMNVECKTRRAHKGYTLVECLYAIILISLVVVAAYSAISFSIVMTEQNDVSFLAIQKTEDIFTCFQSGNLWEEAVKFYTGEEFPSDAVLYFSTNGETTSSNDPNILLRIRMNVSGNTLTVESYHVHARRTGSSAIVEDKIYEDSFTK